MTLVLPVEQATTSIWKDINAPFSQQQVDVVRWVSYHEARLAAAMAEYDPKTQHILWEMQFSWEVEEELGSMCAC